MGTILVTGISGFIGRATAKALEARGHQVIGLDRNPKPVQGASLIKRGDIMSWDLIRDLIQTTDGVINLAGVLGTSELLGSTTVAVRLNIEAAVSIFDACREFNKPAVQITVGNRDWPSIYPITKVAAEKIALAYNKDLGTHIAVVRAMNAYGPYQKHAPVRKLVPNLIRSALLKESARIYGDGEQLIDPIYVDDVGEILADVMDYTMLGHPVTDVFEAGTGNAITVNTFADLVWKFIWGWDTAPKLYEPMRAGEPPNSSTIAALRSLEPLRVLGGLASGHRVWWMNNHGLSRLQSGQTSTRIERGLSTTINWYKENPSYIGCIHIGDPAWGKFCDVAMQAPSA